MLFAREAKRFSATGGERPRPGWPYTWRPGPSLPKLASVKTVVLIGSAVVTALSVAP
jgi:hypothetical protein